MKKIKDYFLGLDIGTGSVGWAVTDDQYNLLKANQKPLWGVKLYETSNTAGERRVFRTSRRRLKRRNQRIKLLQQLFAEEISKIDPGFFLRLKESKYTPEDKLDIKGEIPKLPYALFCDENFTDINFHSKYPTIYHLRNELIQSKSVFDLRLVYLALHHIIKHRGHFLFESLDEDSDIQTFKECWSEFTQSLENSELEIINFGAGLEDGIEAILKNKNYSPRKKQHELKSLLKTKDSVEVEILNMIVGNSVNLVKLFKDGNLKEEEISKFSFRENKYEEDSEKLESLLQERFEIIEKGKAIYDWEILTDILNDSKTLSEAKIKTFDKHKSDLTLLKKLVKRLDPTKKLSKQIFGITSEKGKANYSNYVGFQKKGSKKIPIEKRVSKGEFYKFLKTALENHKKDEEVAKIIEEIELGVFLPKQVIKDNGVIPSQLHLKELKLILENAENYLSFLKDKDENNISVSEKIQSIFKFKIPYYVGPLSSTGDNNAWIVKKSGKNIFPWNFDEIVDTEESAEKFIKRMTNKCTYLVGEDVLPKNSLLYSEFTILNELNNLRVNGERVDPKLKNKIFDELFKKHKKVTNKKLREFLKCEGITSNDDEISGIDGDFKSSYIPFLDFRQLGLMEILSSDEIEHLISDITLFRDDKNLLKSRVKSRVEHHKNISEKQINGICKFSYKDWGRLSKKFLTEIEGTSNETGEVCNIINFMRDTNKNLMELLSSNFDFVEKVENYNKEFSPNMTLNYETVKNLYVSPPVKRSIWQTIKIVKELRKVLKRDPKKVFVEMAREKQESKRTESRKNKLIELYKSCKKDEAELFEAIERGDEHQFRSDRLYLYFIQKGKCLYCGKSIDLDNLYNQNMYDIDHIFPQSKITDDSLDNRVLVDRVCNSQKSDNYPLTMEIINKNKSFWNHLKEIGFISQEKYNRLSRTTSFTNEELGGFINRQLVETRQSTKAVASILKQVFPETEIVYVKAKNVSKFRQDFEIIKVRELNDLHHAKDAFLNIVVGNVYNTKFTNSPNNFIKEAKYREYNLNKLFKQKDVERNGYVAWKTGDDGTIGKIRKIVAKNNVLVVRRSYEVKGGLFDQQILKKGNGQVPIKSEDRIGNIDKYGGYNKASGAYFMLVESKDKKGNSMRTIEFVPVYLIKPFEKNKNLKLEYCENKLKLIEPRIIVEKIKKDSLFSIDGFLFSLAGRSLDRLLLKNENQLVINVENESAIKKIIKFKERTKENRNLKINEKDNLTDNDLNDLYNLFKHKLNNSVYSIMLASIGKTLEEKYNNFLSLTKEEKSNLLCEILYFFQTNRTMSSLALIGGASVTGDIRISKNISKIKSLYLIYMSSTGIFKVEVDLLKS